MDGMRGQAWEKGAGEKGSDTIVSRVVRTGKLKAVHNAHFKRRVLHEIRTWLPIEIERE